MGIAGSAGELYIVEGAEVTSNGGVGQDFVGEGGGTLGSLIDQSGGTYTIANQSLDGVQNLGFYVGHKSGGDGTYNMSGGTFDIQDGRLIIGAGDSRNLGNSNGVMTITGGTVLAEAGIEVGGFETEVGRLDVRGSGTAEIVGGRSTVNDNGGVYVQTDQGTLAVGIDTGGITPIQILAGDFFAGDVTFGDGAILAPYDAGGAAADEWHTIMTWDGELSNDGLTLLPEDDNQWEFRFHDNALQVQMGGGAGLLGDYDGNGELGEPDLNLQAIQIVADPGDPAYDLNSDGKVDFADRQVWVDELKRSWIGDANLDLEFNSGDMVQVFARGKYEKDEDATWGEGDWNGDQKFGSSDMVAAFADGGYEKGQKPQAAVSAVPEPSGWLPLILGVAALLTVRRSCRCKGPIAGPSHATGRHWTPR